MSSVFTSLSICSQVEYFFPLQQKCTEECVSPQQSVRGDAMSAGCASGQLKFQMTMQSSSCMDMDLESGKLLSKRQSLGVSTLTQSIFSRMN